MIALGVQKMHCHERQGRFEFLDTKLRFKLYGALNSREWQTQVRSRKQQWTKGKVWSPRLLKCDRV
jgi:hypothetical protein